MRFEDMLIDTAYPLVEIEDRVPKPDHAHESKCSYCKTNGDHSWKPIADIHVLRTWTSKSKYTPEKGGVDSGGHYVWRCSTSHPFNGKTSAFADRAPEHLRPVYNYTCEKLDLRKKCGMDAVGNFEGHWLCEEHARSVVLRLKQKDMTRDDVDVDLDDLDDLDD